MSRIARNNYEFEYFHIMVQGDERKNIFKCNKEKERYIYLMLKYAFANDVIILSYCVMDNHAHILVCTDNNKRISKMMLQLNTAFGITYNRKRKNVGHVFRDRYRVEIIYTKTHMENCIKYIHNNPVKAHICGKSVDYPYSSAVNYYNINSAYGEQVFKLAGIETESIGDYFQDNATFIDFMDEKNEKDNTRIAYEGIIERLGRKDKYSDGELIDAYKEMRETCNISKSSFASLMKINRHKLSNI
jgi:REP element-mobilizing transposase RayT